MTTVDRVKAVCKSKKIAISTLEKALGYSNGYIGKLKKGVLPDDRLVDIARFLDVPVSYLTGWDDAVSNLNMAGMSELDVAQEMGIDPAVMNSILSGNDAYSAEAVSKFARVAYLIAENKKPATETGSGQIPNYSELSKENQQKVAEYVALLLNAQRNQ